MVKVVEKPLDRLDPMFSEAPTRYSHRLPPKYASSLGEQPRASSSNETKRTRGRTPSNVHEGG